MQRRRENRRNLLVFVAFAGLLIGGATLSLAQTQPPSPLSGGGAAKQEEKGAQPGAAQQPPENQKKENTGAGKEEGKKTEEGTGAGKQGNNAGGGKQATAWLLLLYIPLIVAFPFVLEAVDMHRAYRASVDLRKDLLPLLDHKISAEQLKALLPDLGQGPTGIPGLTRGALAFTLLLIIGIAVFHLLVFSDSTANSLVDKILTLLTGAIASITGFYFGGKTATDAATAASGAQQQSAPVKAAGSITGVTPNKAKVGDPVTIAGSGFGAKQGSVLFDQVAAGTPASWSDTSVSVKVPMGLKAGPVSITVNPIDGSAIAGANTLFTADAPATRGTITKVSPNQAAAKTPVTIEGTGFGPQKGSVLFDQIAAGTITAWSDTSISVEVPAGLKAGIPTSVTVNPTSGSAIVGASNLFTAG